MTVEPKRVRYMPAEYLALERAAETKHEYLDGEIIAMTGASRPHNVITLNLGAELRERLRGTGCQTTVSDMRVRVSPTRYAYPDVVVACPPLQFEDAEVDTLLNPTVIVEVLSPSTEAYDRGQKFAHYRRLESLREYILISEDSMHAERLARLDNVWVLSDIDGPDGLLTFDSIACSVRLADIYERVKLPGDVELLTRLEVAPDALS